MRVGRCGAVRAVHICVEDLHAEVGVIRGSADGVGKVNIGNINAGRVINRRIALIEGWVNVARAWSGAEGDCFVVEHGEGVDVVLHGWRYRLRACSGHGNAINANSGGDGDGVGPTKKVEVNHQTAVARKGHGGARVIICAGRSGGCAVILRRFKRTVRIDVVRHKRVEVDFDAGVLSWGVCGEEREVTCQRKGRVGLARVISGARVGLIIVVHGVRNRVCLPNGVEGDSVAVRRGEHGNTLARFPKSVIGILNIATAKSGRVGFWVLGPAKEGVARLLEHVVL